MFYVQVNFIIIWLLNNIFIIVFGIKQPNELWKEDLLNYLQTVLFCGTPGSYLLHLQFTHKHNRYKFNYQN